MYILHYHVTNRWQNYHHVLHFYKNTQAQQRCDCYPTVTIVMVLYRKKLAVSKIITAVLLPIQQNACCSFYTQRETPYLQDHPFPLQGWEVPVVIKCQTHWYHVTEWRELLLSSPVFPLVSLCSPCQATVTLYLLYKLESFPGRASLCADFSYHLLSLQAESFPRSCSVSFHVILSRPLQVLHWPPPLIQVLK